MASENGKHRKNALTHELFYKLCGALKAEAEWLRKDRPGRKDVATVLSKRLGFEVTEANVEKAHQVTGVEWEPSAAGGSPTAAMIRKLGAQNRALARALVDLCSELGREAPAAVAEIAGAAAESAPTA